MDPFKKSMVEGPRTPLPGWRLPRPMRSPVRDLAPKFSWRNPTLKTLVLSPFLGHTPFFSLDLINLIFFLVFLDLKFDEIWWLVLSQYLVVDIWISRSSTKAISWTTSCCEWRIHCWCCAGGSVDGFFREHLQKILFLFICFFSSTTKNRVGSKGTRFYA